MFPNFYGNGDPGILNDKYFLLTEVSRDYQDQNQRIIVLNFIFLVIPSLII